MRRSHRTASLPTMVALCLAVALALALPFAVPTHAASPALAQQQQTATAGDEPTLMWGFCHDADVGSFVPDGVVANATAFKAAATTALTLSGALALNVTGGMYQLRATVARTTREVDVRFGSLDQLLSTTLPVAAGSAAILAFDWTTPAADTFVEGDAKLVLQVDLYSQELTRMTCVRILLPLELPPPVKEAEDNGNKGIGYVCALISVVFFGTNYLPVKAYDTGDGVFFQWIMAVGIWLVGLVVQLIRESHFEGFAMIGGAMWAIGNTLTVPIIQLIGLGVGMVIWGGAGLVMGWAVGRFGILGVSTQQVDSAAMNSIGITLCILSIGLMFGVKTVKEELAAAALLSKGQLGDPSVTSPSLSLLVKEDGADGYRELASDSASSTPAPVEADWTAGMSAGTKRTIGIALSVVAGMLYGCSFNPSQYLIDSGRGSSHGIDYVFSHFTGILLTSTAYMIAYCIYKRNAPQVMGNLILPGLVSGAGWGIAQTNWFIANSIIKMIGTFPLVSCGPGIVAMLCSIIIYKEVQGKKNFAMLAISTAATMAGVLLIAFSLPLDS